MKSISMPISMIYGHLHGKRPRDKPGKTWLDTVEEDCDSRKVTLTQASHLTKDREKRRELVFRLPAANAFHGHGDGIAKAWSSSSCELH